VYLGLKEDGEVCTTPCTIDAPIGETVMIIEAESRRTLFETLVVKRTPRPVRLTYKLEPAIGTLIVEGGDGATIKLDDQDKGKAPQRITNVAAGGHHVALERNGVAFFDDFVEVEAGQEATLTAPSGGPRGEPPSRVATEASPAPRRLTPMVAASAVMDVGFRQFSYDNNRTPETQHDDRERGTLLTGAIVELWPTTLFGAGVLPNLALLARFEYGVTPRPVTRVNAMTHATDKTTLTTEWQSLEISLRHRWTIADVAALDGGAGFIDDRYRFSGAPADVASVPDATYQALRVGVRGSLRVGSLEPYLAYENRIVFTGGPMERRYKVGASVWGLRTAVGSALHLGRVEVRLEGALSAYFWSFTPDPLDTTQADGGTDLIENLTLAVGYSY
jgi:hypothetical protein